MRNTIFTGMCLLIVILSGLLVLIAVDEFTHTVCRLFLHLINALFYGN